MKHTLTTNNEFSNMLINIDCGSLEKSIFTKVCEKSLDEHDMSRLGLPIGQVFEPSVLKEICLYNNLDLESVLDLSFVATKRATQLKSEILNCEKRNDIYKINVAAKLSSMSRFKLSDEILKTVSENDELNNDGVKVELNFIKFLNANRTSNYESVSSAVESLLCIASTRRIKPDAVANVCAQIVVWYCKYKYTSFNPISEKYYRIATSLANDVFTNSHLSTESKSSWYRAFAMVPAANNDLVETRRMMESAKSFALDSLSKNSSLESINLLKTYYESTIKECIYLSKDFERAENAIEDLINLDPHWSPSHSEASEVYYEKGDYEKALEHINMAIKIGPPYLMYNLFILGKVHRKMNRNDLAEACFTHITNNDPSNITVKELLS
ncbi:hypothetical protein F9L16_22915 [Agarivorans sp. B2Z047]|uniref:tetratricopeptide repeat protein n=1 Tax=Agarivorans sp. B2Z047 TaxID=2652721 RepID=UPI00128C3BDC|nr:tetratricopeptide repeat protein [Agarivorans sp. B2Z047]MPW31824.1 hypothetical protein [Agarivorans sp. B2Z047]UQN41938.1 tetratricopeptide repeat protein [Agarivorans sp. B2Z047]